MNYEYPIVILVVDVSLISKIFSTGSVIKLCKNFTIIKKNDIYKNYLFR